MGRRYVFIETNKQINKQMTANRVKPRKFSIGDRVKVIKDFSSQTMTGTIKRSIVDEEGDREYLLEDIEGNVSTRSDGRQFTIRKVMFYESWLSKI